MNKNIELVWKQFHQELKIYILSQVKDNDIANDILQEVFIKINENIQSLKDDKKLNGWIYLITRNTIMDYFRKSKLNETHNSCLCEDLELKEEHIKLARCVRPFILQLSEKDREVLELTDMDKLSQKELAERLGISYSGAKSRVQRAREKLKNLFEQCCTIKYDKYGNVIDYCKKDGTIDCE